MAIYINDNTDKAAYADQMFIPLIDLFGGDYSDYYISTGDKYLRIETTLATDQQLSDFVNNFVKPIDNELVKEQLKRFKRGFIINRKFPSILDKRIKITAWH